MKLYYLFDETTGEFKGIYEAQENPLEPDAFITPIHSTDLGAPITGANEVAIFASGSWSVQPDYRGQTLYDQTSGATQDAVSIGAIPTGFGLIPPELTLEQGQAAQIATLAAACMSHIYAGFTSAALGSAHTYPAKDRDQTNLSASVTASLLPNLPANWTTIFWCADGSGAWALRPHNIVQIQQAGLDGKAAVEAAIQKNATLAQQVLDAATLAEVQAVVW